MALDGARQGRRDGTLLREAGAARVKCQSEEGAGKHFLGALGSRDGSGLTRHSALQCKQAPDYNT